MTVPKLLSALYKRILNAGDLGAAHEQLLESFVFRGALGSERRGIAEFCHCVQSVRNALSEYRCKILDCDPLAWCDPSTITPSGNRGYFAASRVSMLF